MKVLSILQPWASLVVLGHKKIETRSWNTKYRGELLIHASKASKQVQQFMNDKYEFMNNGVYRQWMDKVLPFGAIIGKVNLIDTFNTNDFRNGKGEHWLDFSGTNEGISGKEEAFGDYSPGRYGWLLSDPVVFNTPIPAKGKLNLWNYDYESRIKAAEELEKEGYL